MNNFNAPAPRQDNIALRLHECTCGAQTFSMSISCPRCGNEMQPMPAKKPTVKRRF